MYSWTVMRRPIALTRVMSWMAVLTNESFLSEYLENILGIKHTNFNFFLNFRTFNIFAMSIFTQN